MKTRLGCVVPFLAAILAGCPATEDATDPGPSDPGTLLDPGTAQDPGTPGDPGTVKPDGDAFTCDTFHFIDFPCDRSYRCKDSTHWLTLESRSCQDEGFDPRCCSGGACAELPGGECPAGTLCRESGDEPCVAAECGRPGDPACPDGDYCALPDGECDAPHGGVCLPTDSCAPYDWRAWEGWVCGCDGASYRSACEARTAGVSTASELPCCDPARMGFDRDNPAGFTGWVACLERPGDGDGALPHEVESVGFAECTQVPGDVVSLGCAAGQVACRGDLAVDPGTTVVQADWWPHACGVSGLPGIVSIRGVGGADDCATVGCGEAPRCGEPCNAPCGCCPCATGAFRCGSTGKDVAPIGYEECRQDGCWQQVQTPCPKGRFCRAADPGEPACVASCEAVAWWWDNLAPGGCITDGDCRVIPGACGVGLGGCWEVVNWWDLEQGYFDVLAQTWADLGCTGPVCDCAQAPSGARCVDYFCQPVP